MNPNSEVGRYRLQQRLPGEGDVWLAEDLEDTGTPVVVKFVPADADVFGYREQGRALAELAQPGIVAPIDSGDAPEHGPFLVFPFVQGRTLRQVLNEDGPLSGRRAGNLLRQIGAALNAAHTKHMVHGSLEPEHIIVSHTPGGRETAHLINFGAYRLGPVSTPLGYLAPETASGQVTSSGDIYSLAAVASEMLTGRRVFRYGSEQDLRKQQRIGVARGALRKLHHNIPQKVEDELRRALQYDPVHRPADAEIFAARIADPFGENVGLPLRRVLLFGALFAAIAGGSAYRACRRR